MPPDTLKIAVLGTPSVSIVRADGTEEPVQLDGGYLEPGLLSALVFFPDVTSRLGIAYVIWGEPEVDDAPRKKLGSLKVAASRLRKKLGDFGHLIPAGEENLRLVTTGPDVVIDWQLAQRLQREGARDIEVLSLIRDTPLPGLNEEGKLHCLGEIREEARRLARRSREALGLDSQGGDDVLFRALPASEARIPAEWPSGRAIDAGPAHPPIRDVARDSLRDIRERDPHAPLFEHDDLFVRAIDGRRRLSQELAQANADGNTFWWQEGAETWFGEYLALWHRTLTTPPEKFRYVFSDERYDAGRFGQPPENDYDNDKAVLVAGGRNFFGDNHGNYELHCARTNWGFAHIWAKDHVDTLLHGEPPLSVFGMRGRIAYPGILGVHTLVCTSDNYLLLSLRTDKVDYHQRMWSASFEESVAVGPREFTGPMAGDENVMHTIAGGLYEEFGISDADVSRSTCLAVGRDFNRGDINGRLDLSSSILAAIRLDLELAEVWECLDQESRIRDRDEHGCWAGVRFGSRGDVLRFLAHARLRKEGTDLLPAIAAQPDIAMDLRMYSRGPSAGVRDRGLMPTSAARLFLGSSWMWAHRWMD